MKRIIILVCLVGLLFRLEGQSYQINYTNKPLTKAFRELIKTYDLKLSYSPSLLKEYTVTKKIDANSPAALINQLIEGLPFTVQDQNKVFLIIPTKPTSINGQVCRQNHRHSFGFALVQSDSRSAVADQNGYFSLPPSEDTVTLNISYLGYKKMDFDVAPDNSRLEIIWSKTQ